MTNVKSSQNRSVTTTDMCDAAVTNVRFDRVQFIRRASIHPIQSAKLCDSA